MTEQKRTTTGESIILTVQEAAELMRVSRPTMLSWTHLAGFPCFRAGRKILIPRKGLTEWAIRQAQEGVVL